MDLLEKIYSFSLRCMIEKEALVRLWLSRGTSSSTRREGSVALEDNKSEVEAWNEINRHYDEDKLGESVPKVSLKS